MGEKTAMKSLVWPVIMLGVLAPLAAAAEPTLPQPLRQESEQRMQQCSTGTIKVWGFIKVGEASVWMPDCSRLKMPLEPPLLLRFGYQREVPGDAFAESALAMLERNLSGENFQQLKARFQQFNAHYQTTSDGDIYSMHYGEDGTLTLWLNDNRLAREQGHDFAGQYLKIWFGPEPFSSRLKKELLSPAS